MAFPSATETDARLIPEMNHPTSHPVQVSVEPQLHQHNRLTCAFRLLLAIPHLLLVGGPLALMFSWAGRPEGQDHAWGAGGGLLGVVAAVSAVIGWFALVFTGRHPEGLWNLSAYYLRWRVRAVAYTALLRDEYPPFGEGVYSATVDLAPPKGPRNRLFIAFRIMLVVPHLLAIWVLGIVWALTTLIAWFSILFTGKYPAPLYRVGVGVLRWNTRVEAYLLLLHDVYPPFSLD